MNLDEMKSLIFDIGQLPIEEKIDAINTVREWLHVISPFQSEPVDFVKWVKNPLVHANDYNPNSVAPPEMELLRHSIASDGSSSQGLEHLFRFMRSHQYG